MKTIIFTDGSSRGNPGPGGWGTIVGYTEEGAKKVKELGGREENTTNNRMEMMAVIEGLTFARKNIPNAEIVVNTDSEYVKKGSTLWAKGWAANGWKTKANQAVLNKDLWQKMLALTSELKIDWKVIPGHSGIPGNERCDVIATSFADGNPEKLFYGDISGYRVPLEIKSSFGAVEKKSSAPKSFKGKGAYSYVSVIRGIVKIHKTWAECEERVKGVQFARYKKAMTKDEETNLIKEFTHR
ncbi:MAG: RNase H family protein [Patescibacteria group bacterium]